MTVEEIQTICNSFPGVTNEIRWEDHLCFYVGGKMFLVTAPDHVPVSATIKVSDEDFELLQQREGIIPAPYMARYKWLRLDNIHRFTNTEWEHYLKIAYDLVFSKLPAKSRKEISGK